MSSRNKLFVWFNRDQGKYLMVSEWTSNPRQLIIINYWQRKQLEYYQILIIMEISSKIFNDGHEDHDNLGSHMAGQPTLRLEKLQFDIAKCTIDSIIIIW